VAATSRAERHARSNCTGPNRIPETPAVPLTHYLWILKPTNEDRAFVLASGRVHLRRFQTSYPIYESRHHYVSTSHTAYGVVGQGSTVSDSYDRISSWPRRSG